MKIISFLITVAAATIVGCGGSDPPVEQVPAPVQAPPPSPSPSPAPPVPLEGVFGGAVVLARPLMFAGGGIATSLQLYTVHLEDSTVWGFQTVWLDFAYKASDAAVAAFHAKATYANGQLTANDVRNYRVGLGGEAGSMSGTYTHTALRGSFGDTLYLRGYHAERFDGTMDYEYERPANPAELVGSWQAYGVDAEIASKLSIASDGTIVGDWLGCGFTASAVPRASGRNVFDVALTFGNSSRCEAPGERQAGIAVVVPVNLQYSSGWLLLATQNAERTRGFAWSGDRSW